MVGAFHSVGQFFDELGRLPRIVSVNKVKLSGNVKDEVVKVNTECLATTYRFLDQLEARVPDVNKSKKRHRKK
jgi:Tfp pilus assembly protein PilO